MLKDNVEEIVGLGYSDGAKKIYCVGMQKTDILLAIAYRDGEIYPK